MPALKNLRSRLGKVDSPAEGPPAPGAVLPSLEDRRRVSQRLLEKAEAICAQRGAALDVNRDLERKESKRRQQLEAHETYKDRLEGLLMGGPLQETLSACLLLPPESLPSGPSDSGELPAEGLECVALLLGNLVLWVAGRDNNPKASSSSSSGNGYDARVRNLLRIACVELLAEGWKAQDTDGALLEALEARGRPPVSWSAKSLETTTEGDLSKSQVSGIGSQLSQLMGRTSSSLEDEETNENAATDDDDDEQDLEDPPSVYADPYRRYATQKFRALEEGVAEMMMAHILRQQQQQQQQQQAPKDGKDTGVQEGEDGKGGRFNRKNLIRAAKIGGVGVVAGTLFAVTGGLAAPGIAAGLAALGVGGTIGALVTSQLTLIALFGLGGGGLSAYKMKRRTDGLTEFEIRRANLHASDQKSTDAHLHTTVCVSGWLQDEHDFERPWGVDLPGLGRSEQLRRFFARFDPERLGEVEDLADGDFRAWRAIGDGLRERYGRGVEDVLPVEDPAVRLTPNEQKALTRMFAAVLQSAANAKLPSRDATSPLVVPNDWSTLLVPTSAGNREESKIHPDDRVWDYQTEFGGDLYTLRWETDVLLKMCKVVNNMARELAKGATQEVLKKTALYSILTAVALPAFMVSMAGSIDNEWTLVTIRSDLAGIELAKSLLQSDERRPVNLIGQSFGGRVVLACLAELARHQKIWEEEQKQEQKQEPQQKFGAKKQLDDFKLKFQTKQKLKADRDGIAEYKREPASIVQDVIIMGTPLFVSRSELRLCRQMVAGRFVNCYSTKDWVISLMFQYKSTSSLTRSVYGTAPVDGVHSIENYNVTKLVSTWHPNYCRMVPEILDLVGFDQPTSF